MERGLVDVAKQAVAIAWLLLLYLSPTGAMTRHNDPPHPAVDQIGIGVGVDVRSKEQEVTTLTHGWFFVAALLAAQAIPRLKASIVSTLWLPAS